MTHQQGVMAMTWMVKEPGHIVLLGTDFSIRVATTKRNIAYVPMYGEVNLGAHNSLDGAKLTCHERRLELRQVGLSA